MKKDFISYESGFFYSKVNVFNDHATKNKISRHLLDINDVISEEDIRSALVTFPETEIERKMSLSKAEKQINVSL